MKNTSFSKFLDACTQRIELDRKETVREETGNEQDVENSLS